MRWDGELDDGDGGSLLLPPPAFFPPHHQYKSFAHSFPCHVIQPRGVQRGPETRRSGPRSRPRIGARPVSSASRRGPWSAERANVSEIRWGFASKSFSTPTPWRPGPSETSGILPFRRASLANSSCPSHLFSFVRLPLLSTLSLLIRVKKLSSPAEPSPALLLAARCQHLNRFATPRASYPEGKAGYLKWRASIPFVFHVSTQLRSRFSREGSLHDPGRPRPGAAPPSQSLCG